MSKYVQIKITDTLGIISTGRRVALREFINEPVRGVGGGTVYPTTIEEAQEALLELVTDTLRAGDEAVLSLELDNTTTVRAFPGRHIVSAEVIIGEDNE